MITLIEKQTRVSIHLMGEEQTPTLDENGLHLGELDPGDASYTNETSELITVENVPEDWYGRKYIYTAEGTWELNPNDPTLAP
jgi:hypothetical protein